MMRCPETVAYVTAAIGLGVVVAAGLLLWGSLADVLSPARNLIRFAIFGTVASVAAALPSVSSVPTIQGPQRSTRRRCGGCARGHRVSPIERGGRGARP